MLFYALTLTSHASRSVSTLLSEPRRLAVTHPASLSASRSLDIAVLASACFRVQVANLLARRVRFPISSRHFRSQQKSCKNTGKKSVRLPLFYSRGTVEIELSRLAAIADSQAGRSQVVS